jgi:hypothetical protein
MSKDSRDPTANAPVRTVHDAYRRCLQAREQWLQVASLGKGDDAQEAAHAELHAATLTWAETLQPYAAATTGEVERLWTSAPLWPIGPKQRKVPVCVECDATYMELDAGDRCDECGATVVTGVEYVRGEDGQIEQEYERGLDSLSNYRDRTEVIEREVGTFNPTTRVEERPIRLPPENLFRAARLLDRLAQQAELLATPDNPLADPQEV